MLPIDQEADQSPTTLDECTPRAMLKLAVWKDDPHLNFPPQAMKRRMTKKGMPAEYLGHVLADLQADIDHEWDVPCTWAQCRQADYEYEFDVRVLFNRPIRLLRTVH